MGLQSKILTPTAVLDSIQFHFDNRWNGKWGKRDEAFDLGIKGLNFTNIRTIQSYPANKLWSDLYTIYEVVNRRELNGRPLSDIQLQEYVKSETEKVANKLEDSLDMLRGIFFAWSDFNHRLCHEKTKGDRLDTFRGVTPDYRF
jgi:hypothetical protein